MRWSGQSQLLMGSYKRANLYTIGLSAIGVDLIGTEKIIILRLGFNLECLSDTTQTPAFDLIGVTGGPA